MRHFTFCLLILSIFACSSCTHHDDYVVVDSGTFGEWQEKVDDIQSQLDELASNGSASSDELYELYDEVKELKNSMYKDFLDSEKIEDNGIPSRFK